MAWNKVYITRDNGQRAEAQAPIIVSASRSTDIPAFYADWFFKRLNVGYSAWTNPFNGIRSFVSYENTRFIVFWSKNPRPLLDHLDELKSNGRSINCYIQYTLNDYEREGLEKGVPALANRIDTFKRLVDKLGPGHVIWRFDPMILTDRIVVDDLLKKVENIGDQLKGYTEKLVFSYADIAAYKKVKANLQSNGVNYHEWCEEEMVQFASALSSLNKKWNYVLATCGEKINIEKYGIMHNKCIDDDLIIKLAYHDDSLMNFLGIRIENSGLWTPDNAIEVAPGLIAVKTKKNKDSGQRAFCGCIASKDIGEYNTCPHQCEYCYANTSKIVAINNWKRHQSNPISETIVGL